MTYIPDLAPYDYHQGAPEALAVGWLDSEFPFAPGPCPQDVLHRLAHASREPVRLMRGSQFCQFCLASAPLPRLLRADIRLFERPDVACGNGEIWFTGEDGTNFAAPALIVHYIEQHSYMPPPAVIEAVRRGARTPGIT